VTETGGSDPSLDRAAAGTPSQWKLLGRLFALGFRYRGACALVVLLHLALVALTLSGLGLTGVGIDYVRHHVDPASNPPQWPFELAPPTHWSPRAVVAAIAGAVFAAALISALLKYVAAVATAGLTQRVLIQLRSDVFEKLQRVGFRFYDSGDSSSIINRAAGDVNAVKQFVDGVLIKVLTVTLTLAVYLVYMLKVHVLLTLVCLATTPLLWWGAVVFSRIVQPAYRKASEHVDAMIRTLAENVQGIHVVKGFAREPEEIAKFREANRRIREQKEGIFHKVSTFQPLMGFLTQVNMLVLLGYGGYLAVHGQVLLGAGLYVFANLLHEFANQVSQITNIANTIQASLIAAQRVFEVLDAPVEIASPPDAVRFTTNVAGTLRVPSATAEPSPPADGTRSVPATLAGGTRSATEGRARGEIAFEHVSFAYRAGPPVLSDVTFRVEAGEVLGITGETGAGKTTLLSLVMRFYDVSAGSVAIDGHDVRRLDIDDLRKNVGMVFQESFLFSNTIAANIAFGDPDAAEEDIERAARIAAAHDFIAETALGYETMVGEHGANLSGGQRQRLAIARALLPDPPILLFDDATASVDSQTEHEIQEALDSAMLGRTTLVVSNRLSTLRRTDRILVLDDGRLIALGAHHELLHTCPYYRKLAELQFADGVEEVVGCQLSVVSDPLSVVDGTLQDTAHAPRPSLTAVPATNN
jgi:ATP-binding cassette subfamily B protein